jgi:hypothetical protein
MDTLPVPGGWWAPQRSCNLSDLANLNHYHHSK